MKGENMKMKGHVELIWKLKVNGFVEIDKHNIMLLLKESLHKGYLTRKGERMVEIVMTFSLVIQ
jgi:hypothetical protein